MTAIPQPNSISDRLVAPLREVAKRQWYVLAGVGMLKTLISALLVLLVAAMLLGTFHGMWMPARVAVAALAWILVIGSAIRFLRPALRRWGLGRAAMQVEQLHPAMQERLSSAVELCNEKDPTFRGSPALIGHLIRQAETDASFVKPALVIPTDRVVRWALLFVPVLLAWLVIAMLSSTSNTAMAGLYRMLMPWTNRLPTLLTQVVVQPGDVTLVQGDPIDIAAHINSVAGSRELARATLIREFANGQRVNDDMERQGARDYRLHFDDQQQTYRYRVTTEQGDSGWYTATVHPRPQINSIDIHCEYPAYTHLASTVVSGKDGSIEALVGTRVTITVHTAQPVVVEKSRIAIDEGTPDALILPLTQVAAGMPDYQAQLIVNHSGQYKINLTNEFDLTNKDEQPRSIVATPDDVPTIVIRSPEPEVQVRADDVVPVKYLANDDFGVAKIEAVLQVDDKPAQTVPVPFKTTDPRTVTGPSFPISVADVLKSQNLTSADHITYQLRVTDNRDPDPQFSYSDRQTLKINRNEVSSFQNREDRKLAEDLRKAIQQAIHDLDHAREEVQPAKDIDARQPLQKDNTERLHKAAHLLPRTSRDLQKAADEAKNTVFQDVARDVTKIVTHPMRTASEETAAADLNADKGQDRKDSATRAVAAITESRDALEKLLDKQEIQKDEHNAEAARDLAEAAKKQEEAAAMMKPHDQVASQKDPQAHQEQREAMRKQEQADQKLRQAIDQSEALRDPKAQETAQKLQDLVRKVEEAEKQQDANAQQTEKQEAAADAQDKANEIAKKQEALNKDIQQAAQQNRDADQKAGVQPPNKDQQNEIVKNLDRNNLQQAHDQMKQAANQLHQEAQQLANLAKANDLRPNAQQQDAQNKDQQHAQDAQNEKNNAQQAANALKQEAQQNATPKADDAAIHNAEQEAKNIEQKAADLHPQDAQAQQADQAAQQDAQAAEKAAEQAAQAANPQDAQKDLNDAAQDLNKAAAELADAAKDNADADKKSMVKSQQQDAQAAADQAAAQADQQDALAKALEPDQTALAQAQQNQQNPDQTTQQQNQVAEKAREAQQQAEQLQHQAQDAKNPDVAHRAEEAKADLAQAQQHAEEAAHAEQHAAQAEQQAANAPDANAAHAAEQEAGKALEQAQQNQQQAQDALAKAESALRNIPDQQQAQADADHGQGQHEDTPHAAEQQQAAQGAQEAAQAQQEATQQNPAAAQEAARALNQAAQAMARAVPGLHPEDGQDPSNDPSNDPAQDPSTTPGQTPDSKQGIQSAQVPVEIPASVRDIGISADQWAKLPPLAKKELLNAAQQSGPPSYRQMIKDYYVRIAKIEQPAPAGQ